MKRYLGIFILTVIVGLSGCTSDTDSDTQVINHDDSVQMKQNKSYVQTFNGHKQIRATDICGHHQKDRIRIKMAIFWMQTEL